MCCSSELATIASGCPTKCPCCNLRCIVYSPMWEVVVRFLWADVRVTKFHSCVRLSGFIWSRTVVFLVAFEKTSVEHHAVKLRQRALHTASAVSITCSRFIKRLKVSDPWGGTHEFEWCVLRRIHCLLVGPSMGLVILHVALRLDLYKLLICNVRS